MPASMQTVGDRRARPPQGRRAKMRARAGPRTPSYLREQRPPRCAPVTVQITRLPDDRHCGWWPCLCGGANSSTRRSTSRSTGTLIVVRHRDRRRRSTVSPSLETRSRHLRPRKHVSLIQEPRNISAIPMNDRHQRGATSVESAGGGRHRVDQPRISEHMVGGPSCSILKVHQRP